MPDIVCITETWLDNSISDNELTIPGYCIIRLDRNRHRGGVLMYIRCTLHPQVLSLGPSDLELLIVSINNATCKYCMGLFYRPPGSASLIFDNLFSVLEQLDPSLFLNFVLIGDFNVNFLNPQHFLYHQLSCILSSFNHTQVVPQPTHVSTSGGATLIDLVLLSNPQQLQDCSVIPELSHSDHKGISLTMRWKTARDCQPKTSRPIWRYAMADFSRAYDLLDANIISSKVQKLVGLLFRQFYRCADTDTIRKLYIAIIRPQWDLSYPAMLRTLSIPTLAAQRQQLKLCTFFRYVNQLSVAPIANITHRIPPF